MYDKRAAKRLDVDEATLWYRCKLEPELDAYVKSERTKLAALAETSIYELVKAKDPSMCRFAPSARGDDAIVAGYEL